MKKMLSLFLVMTAVVMLGVGCNPGPEDTTQEDAKKGMEETMAIDTMEDTAEPSP